MKSSISLIIAIILLLSACAGEKSADELMALAKKSYDKKEYFQARQYLAEAIKLKPTDKEIVFQIGKTYMAENMFDSAYAHLGRADKLYPFDRQIILLLHEASVKTEHWNAAIDALLNLSKTGDPIEQYYRQIAEYALKDSAGHIAFYYYGKMVELEPDSLSHYLNQADGGMLEGEPLKSIEVLRAALKKFGDRPVILSELGRFYGVVGNLAAAEKTYRLLATKDSSPVFQLQLATVLSIQPGRAKKEEAYAMFKRLRQETSDTRRVDSILSALESELNQGP
jgi:predicted Zn-dependent protease